MAYLDRERAQSLLRSAELDAIILLSPESFYYSSGAQPGVATMWRKAGAVATLVPAVATEDEMAVVSDLFAPDFIRNSHIKDVRISPIWVETSTIDAQQQDVEPTDLIAEAWRIAGREQGFSRPTTFDPAMCYRHIADALREKGLSTSRIGFEGDALTVNDFALLAKALPDVELYDASEIVARLKMVKCDDEITHLRQAVTLAEQGINDIVSAIRPGITRNELASVWQQSIVQNQADIPLTGLWEYISVGNDPWGANASVSAQDLIKVDVGCVVNGYTSDSGRTFVMNKPSKLQRSLFDALAAGFHAGSALLRPGVKLGEIHAVTQRAIREAGFPAYTRGHFGHGLGAGVGSEQWPFIAADSHVALEPGMVLAFECPWYINGLGGMIIENQVLITADGHEMMNSLPLDLQEIAG